MTSEMNDGAPGPSAVSSASEDIDMIVDDTVNPGEEILRDAAAHYIEVNPLGFNEARLTRIHQEISDLVKAGKDLAALKIALEHACRWGFVDCYEVVFNCWVGVDHSRTINNDQHLFFLLSFRAEVNGMKRETKVWIAQRILSLMRRSYADVELPEPILFSEPVAGQERPSILLSSILGFPDLARVFNIPNNSYRTVIVQLCQRLGVNGPQTERRVDATTEGDHPDMGGQELESANK
ncbi:hypothetical protein GGR58DRAFT_529448 [Xylaria digitata]|nr:hypothetical protein GGR58DRAFT_529448 [Xylaria digitata]